MPKTLQSVCLDAIDVLKWQGLHKGAYAETLPDQGFDVHGPVCLWGALHLAITNGEHVDYIPPQYWLLDDEIRNAIKCTTGQSMVYFSDEVARDKYDCIVVLAKIAGIDSIQALIEDDDDA